MSYYSVELNTVFLKDTPTPPKISGTIIMIDDQPIRFLGHHPTNNQLKLYNELRRCGLIRSTVHNFTEQDFIIYGDLWDRNLLRNRTYLLKGLRVTKISYPTRKQSKESGIEPFHFKPQTIHRIVSEWFGGSNSYSGGIDEILHMLKRQRKDVLIKTWKIIGAKIISGIIDPNSRLFRHIISQF
jgi:hypothetical protein